MRKTLARRPKKTKDALQIIDRMIGDDTKLRKLVAEAGVNAHIAQLIYDARTAAGLTQADLARLTGTKQPVIARLEDADYRGHSFTILQRIAAALNQRLVVRFTPATDRQRLPRHQLQA
jgi:ribosome-binding protein aMBF1 (putative translation factor)